MLTIQSLKSDGSVIESTPFDQGEMNPIAYVDAAVEAAKVLLRSEGFVGLNTRVMRGEQLVWMSYRKG